MPSSRNKNRYLYYREIEQQQAFPAESLLFLGLQGGMQKNLKKSAKKC